MAVIHRHTPAPAQQLVFPVRVRAAKPLNGFDWDDITAPWAYQMVPLGGRRLLRIANWDLGDFNKLRVPSCVAMQEWIDFPDHYPDRTFELIGLSRGSGSIVIPKDSFAPFEIQVRVKPAQEVAVMFHFVTDTGGKVISQFAPAYVHDWINGVNSLLEPQANFSLISRGVRFLELPESHEVGTSIVVSDTQDDEGSRFGGYCEPNCINIFLVWGIQSHVDLWPLSFYGTVLKGDKWWRRAILVGDAHPNMIALMTHLVCRALWAPVFNVDSSRLMNGLYLGDRVDHLTNDRINPSF